MRIIQAPTFILSRFHPDDNTLVERTVINEYTLRALQVDVKIGLVSNNLRITDECGTTAGIQENGMLTNQLHGLGLNAGFIHELFN